VTHPAAKAAAERLTKLVHEGKSAGEAARIVGLSPFACEVFEAVMEYKPREVPVVEALTRFALQTRSVLLMLQTREDEQDPGGRGKLHPRALFTCYPKSWDVDVKAIDIEVIPPDPEKLS